MCPTDRKEIGSDGEQKASDYLQDKGYEIVSTNYRYKRGEVDLIAKKGSLLVFVEVKTRNNLQYGNPESFVSARQQELILEAANAYMIDTDWQGLVRYDIIAVVPGKEIEHFEDAFY
ncbi:MAG: YraN family protein [Bacteroidota bacterium]